MSSYTHVFFDLDHTLWDFEANSRFTIEQLFAERSLADHLGCDVERFYQKYIEINDAKWDLYRRGAITKERLRAERFVETYAAFGSDDHRGAQSFEEDYLSQCPYQGQLMEGALEAVQYLAGKYELHIITNGFHETQLIKLRESGLADYFGEVVSSDRVGVNKPNRKIFAEALRLADARRKHSVMIGDNLAIDVLGARDSGLAQVFYNPSGLTHSERITFEISELRALRDIL